MSSPTPTVPADRPRLSACIIAFNEADRIGAEICGRPLWLANALENIQASAARIDNVQAENNPATAHMFIINPLHSRSVDGLFRTHPSTEERVRRLRAMAGPAATLAGLPRGPWAILIGPEGGWSESERTGLGALAHVTRVSLGPRILRADTAAVASLALWQAALGDWG